MSYFKTRVNLAGMVSGVVLLGSDLFAQGAAGSVSWVQNATVPMSTTSMVIMIALFLFIGIWMLPKVHKNTQNFFAIALFMTTIMFGYQAVASWSPASITTSAGTIDPIYDGQPLQNNYSQAVQITEMTSSSCTIPPNPGPGICKVGMVLQNGESCEFQIDCPT